MNLEKYFTEKEFDMYSDLSCKMIEEGLVKESDLLMEILNDCTVEEFEALRALVNMAHKKEHSILGLTPENLKMASNSLQAMQKFRALLDSLNMRYFDSYRFAANVKVVDEIVIDSIVYTAISCYNEVFTNGQTNS